MKVIIQWRTTDYFGMEAGYGASLVGYTQPLGASFGKVRTQMYCSS